MVVKVSSLYSVKVRALQYTITFLPLSILCSINRKSKKQTNLYEADTDDSSGVETALIEEVNLE